MIPSSAYSSPDVYAAEQLRFRQCWQFLGFTSQLTQNQDFICRTIGARSVVVQNFHGELRAFHNVCSHRFSRIQQEGCGNRVLQCPYHGWTYDADGIPIGIPKRPRFDDLNADCISSLRLSKWRVEICGGLVFVTENSDGPSLKEYLGEAYSTVNNLTSALGKRLDTNEMIIRANWKVLVENTLESYHVNFVHGDSFKRLGVEDGEFHWQHPHSSWTTSVSSAVRKAMARPLELLSQRPCLLEGYFHQLIFPNVTIATTFGTSFSIQHFEPNSPDSTRFTTYLFETSLPAPNNSQEAVLEAMGTSAIKFNRQVFEEDRIVCEVVQQGSSETDRAGLLSDEELRVAEFQRSYVSEFMNSQPPDPASGRVLIVGAGDFGRELYEWVTQAIPNSDATIGFLDDNLEKLDNFPHLKPFLTGRISDYRPLSGDKLLMGVSDPEAKLRIGIDLQQRGAVFNRFVHPTATIATSATLGTATIACPGVVVSCNAVVGDFVTLNCAATVGHDAVIGHGSTLSGHCDVTGHVVLGQGVFMGSHASILPKVKVGDFAKIGAGSVAIRAVKPHATMMGVPASRLDLPRQGD